MPRPTARTSLAARQRDFTMINWKLPYQPTCPFCLSALVGDAIVYHRHLAMCVYCWNAGERVSRRFYRRSAQLKLGKHFATHANLLYFVPREDWPARTSLHLALGLKPLHPSHRTRPERTPPPDHLQQSADFPHWSEP